MRDYLVPLTAATLLAGCNFAPQYEQPVSPITDTFPYSTATASTQPFAADLGWREYFADERLKTLISAALTNNRDLAQSMARIAQARAQFGIEDSQRLPQLDLGGSYTRTKQPLSALGAGSSTGASGSVIYDSEAANLSISNFELDLWGRVKNLSDQAKAQYLGSVQGARAFRLSLISQVTAAYYQQRSGEERIALANDALTGRLEGQRIALRRLDAGVTSTVDYNQAVLLTTQAKAELADLHRTTEQAANLLTVLIGGPLKYALPPARPLDDSTLLSNIAPGLPSDVLTNRPDVLEAEFNLRAANANIGAARAAFFPSISLTGQYGFAAPALGDLFKGGAKTWSYGGNIDLPIFDWGRRKAQLQLSRAQADELTSAYQSAVQGAFREVADALAARRRYEEQLTALTETVQAQQQLAYTASRRYEQGLSIYLEVLDAERSLFSAQQQLIDLRSVALQNNVSLYVALGGGLRERAGAPPDQLEAR